jgi:hypothetical protein
MCKTDGVKRPKRVIYIIFTFYFAAQVKREQKKWGWKQDRRE